MSTDEMEVLPLELKKNIFLFAPIGSIISDNTSKEEIEFLFAEKVKDYENNGLKPYAYIWLSFKNGMEGDIVVRVTICCGEYIVGLVLYDINQNTIKEWNLNSKVEKRNILSFPKEGIFHWYGTSYALQYIDDNVIINKLTEYKIMYKKQEFIDFLNGNDDTRIRAERVMFLDYNIVETLADKKIEYYGILRVFEYLYGKGYWTYGGFKNFDIKRTLSRRERLHAGNVTYVTYGSDKYFVLSKDGKIKGENLDPKISSTLEVLGAIIL
jgi:hypothetical protein